MDVLNQNLILLKNNDEFYTDNDRQAFKVKKGEVIVFLVPLKGTTPGRRLNIYEAKEGETLPALKYKDNNFTTWTFCFKAVNEAEISIIDAGATKVLKRKFADKVDIKNVQEEGFEQAVVEHYEIKNIEEDSLIHRTKEEKKKVSKDAVKLIYNALKKETFSISDGRKSHSIYQAMGKMCDYYDIPIASYDKIKESCGDEITPQNIARVSHFCYREIVLEENWFKQDLGPILAFDKDNNPIACIPKGRNKYIAHDIVNERKYNLSSTEAYSFSVKGFMIYKTFPNKSMSTKDLVEFCKNNISKSDLIAAVVLTAIGTAIGVLLPYLNEKLFDTYIPLSNESLIISICCVIASFMIGNIFFSIVDNVATFRLSSKLSYVIQSATYDRLFNLPESFFRNYESADLAQRAMGAGNAISQFVQTVMTSVLAGVCSCFYLIKMFSSSTKLTVICLLMIVVYAAIVYFVSLNALKYQYDIAELDGKSGSIIYQFLTGIDKIRISGVENRALFEYYKPFSKKKTLEMKAERIDQIGDTLAVVAESIFAMIIYIIIVKSKIDISVGAFVALNTSFGYFSSGILQLIEGLISIKAIQPSYKRFKPILEAVSELDDGKDLPGEITGNISVENVTFSYSEDSPIVINDMSLNIKKGEYIGIVGASGCGKSTLLKLLLGFERPKYGRIYYDGKDIESFDKREFRKKLGVVLQNGDLISGSIFDNITITAPKATVKDVEEVIEAVGLADDISEMPMGLHTMLSEGCGTISGGQQQRILIARAIINKPDIIFFDEATSALDNITQAKVCETLEQLNSTRLVIAHRLSTIMNCDRILVLDKGRIVEEGTFSELMEQKGLFHDLAIRQM